MMIYLFRLLPDFVDESSSQIFTLILKEIEI